MINKREGSFSGMKEKYRLNIVVVNENQGIGLNVSQNINKSIIYKGEQVQIKLK